jgi:hypothetical protein
MPPWLLCLFFLNRYADTASIEQDLFYFSDLNISKMPMRNTSSYIEAGLACYRCGSQMALINRQQNIASRHPRLSGIGRRKKLKIKKDSLRVLDRTSRNGRIRVFACRSNSFSRRLILPHSRAYLLRDSAQKGIFFLKAITIRQSCSVIVVGIITLVASLTMDTSVPSSNDGRMHTIGLLNQKQNFIIVSGLMLIIGIILNVIEIKGYLAISRIIIQP